MPIRDRYPMFYKGHPKLFFKPKPIFWWTSKWVHGRFILRETTSLGVGWFSLQLIMLIAAIRQGSEAYLAFQSRLSDPFIIVVNLLSLLLVLYHSITWFNLAPKAMVIRIGTKKIPGILIAGLNYGAWVVMSLAIMYLFFNV